MNREQKCLILTLFQLQNGNRKLSEFTDVGKFPDCFVSELELRNTDLRSTYLFHWFYFNDNDCRRWDNTRSKFETFPIFDYISFEDKI